MASELMKVAERIKEIDRSKADASQHGELVGRFNDHEREMVREFAAVAARFADLEPKLTDLAERAATRDDVEAKWEALLQAGTIRSKIEHDRHRLVLRLIAGLAAGEAVVLAVAVF